MAKIDKIALIKEIRTITDAPMLDCREALENSDWDLDKAITWLNQNKLQKAAKKSTRIAAEGIVKYAENSEFAILYELNSETDFVVKNDKFQTLAKEVEATLLANEFNSVEDLTNVKTVDGKPLLTLVDEATGVIGEKISLRRAVKFSKSNNLVAGYTHGNFRIAAAVIGQGNDATVLSNLAMHIAAMNPEFALVKDVPESRIKELVDKYSADELLAKKPEKIREQIVQGKVNKDLSDFVLEKQQFVMESGMTVEQYLKNNNTVLNSFVRMELAEGIEKAVVDFATEVKAQIK